MEQDTQIPCCPKCGRMLESCPDPACRKVLHHFESEEDCNEDVLHKDVLWMEPEEAEEYREYLFALKDN